MFGWYDEDDHQWQAWVGVAVAVTGGLILRQKRRPSRTRELSTQHFCVTGSSCGIGEAVVKELVQRGAGSVVLAVRNEHRGAQIVKELRELYGISTEELSVVGLDLLSVESCRDFKKNAAVRDGPLSKMTCLINNAGAMFPAYKVSDKSVEDTMMTNFLGPLYITKALLPTLRRNASPGSPSRVICTGSKLEKRSTLESGTKEDDVRGLTNEYKLFQAYANSKHALHLCTDALITEEKEIVCHIALQVW